jgi:hypothetical protein
MSTFLVVRDPQPGILTVEAVREHGLNGAVSGGTCTFFALLL